MAEHPVRISALRSICILIMYVCSAYSTEYVPVFMWESSSELHPIKEVPALARISADEFKDIVLHKLKKKPVVVVFAEESLSVEDFSWQDEAGEGAFPNLENISTESDGLTYLPFVHAPLRAFHHHLPIQGQNWHNAKLGPNGLLSDAAMNETLLFLNLDDATSSEDRPGLLKRHDALISQVYRKLAEQHSDVLAVYTAHHSSWQSAEETLTRRVRHLLSIEAAEEELPVYSNNHTFLYAPTIHLTIDGNSTTLENGTAGGEEVDLTISFPYDVTLVFLFENASSSGYWNLRAVNVTKEGKTYTFMGTEVGAPLDFSYNCGQGAVFVNGSNTLNTSNNFQIQAYMRERRFGSAYDCIYFFTVPIWSALFVCAILGVIMMFGLVMIMDIKTMDMFDDPKGKTITINVSE